MPTSLACGAWDLSTLFSPVERVRERERERYRIIIIIIIVAKNALFIQLKIKKILSRSRPRRTEVHIT